MKNQYFRIADDSVNNRVLSLVTNVNKKRQFPKYEMWVKLIFIGIITVIVAFKDAVYISYYEMYLKYCQYTDVYQ